MGSERSPELEELGLKIFLDRIKVQQQGLDLVAEDLKRRRETLGDLYDLVTKILSRPFQHGQGLDQDIIFFEILRRDERFIWFFQVEHLGCNRRIWYCKIVRLDMEHLTRATLIIKRIDRRTFVRGVSSHPTNKQIAACLKRAKKIVEDANPSFVQ